MLKWKWQVIENRVEWRLVSEDDETKVIGSVISTECYDYNDTFKTVWKIEAECEEIGYKAVQERVDKKFFMIMAKNMRNFIREEVEKNRGYIGKHTRHKKRKMKETWVQDANVKDALSIITDISERNAEYILNTGSMYIIGRCMSGNSDDVGIYFRSPTSEDQQ